MPNRYKKAADEYDELETTVFFHTGITQDFSATPNNG
jgi:hypothetical protein